ncbi:MAG: hypothetical protein ACUVWP_08725, partial [bacterium]
NFIMKRRSYIIFSSAIFIAVLVGVFLLNYKTVNIPGYGDINIFFGRAFKGDISLLEKHASKLITDGDFEGAKEIGEVITKYGGDRKSIGFLIISESNWKAGAVKDSLRALSEVIRSGGINDRETFTLLSNFSANCLEELISKKPFKIYPSIFMLHILKNSESLLYEKYLKDVQSLLSKIQPIEVQFVHKRDKKYLTRDGALNDVKSEGVFESKKEAPSILLKEIKKVADFEDILTDGDMLEYIRGASSYELLKVDVKRVPMDEEPLPEDILEEEREQVGGAFSVVSEKEYGYQGEATYIVKIKNFSIDSLLKECKVDIYSIVEQEISKTK